MVRAGNVFFEKKNYTTHQFFVLDVLFFIFRFRRAFSENSTAQLTVAGG